MSWYDFILNNPQEIVRLTIQHIRLVLFSSFLSILIGVPLGILITRKRYTHLREPILNLANIVQTIPSLAVVGLALPVLGLGFKPAIFALFIYALLPIIRNTFTGIANLDNAILESGVGMGMTPYQVLYKIELPLALPVIMAGIRTAMVINVGTAALVFLIGGGGLGDLIFTGISMVDVGIMLAGAIPTAIMAILVDFLLARVEFYLTPQGLRIGAR